MTSLELSVTSYRGGEQYLVDLTEFSDGGVAPAAQGSKAWGGDFSGRPQFAEQIAVALGEAAPTEDGIVSWKSSLRNFFRYLDWKEKRTRGLRVETCAEVTDAMGIELRQWLGGNPSAYNGIKTVLNAVRSANGLRQLFWPSRHPDKQDAREPPSPKGMRRLYHAFKNEGRQIKAMFLEGERLAALGSDPRRYGGWDLPQNRTFLLRALLEEGVPDRARLSREGADRLRRKAQGPAYLAPTMDARYASGLCGVARWFVPGRAETSVFFWLFMLGTGWNPSTAVGVDVLDQDGWSQSHPQSDLFKVIHAWKSRSDRHQFTISMKKPEWHPYRILEFMIAKTAPLRRQVLNELEETRRKAAADPELDLKRRIAELDRLSRSPWLFATRNMGEVSGFVGEPAAVLVQVARAVVGKYGLNNDDWKLGDIIAKDARLAWIGHVYVHSGYHQLLTMLAGNHGSLRTTLAVLFKSEADVCRSKNALPRASKVVLSVEAKYYVGSTLGLGLGRAFLGLCNEIQRMNRFFIATSPSKSIAKLLSKHTIGFDLEFTPAIPHNVEVMRGLFEKVFASFIAQET